MITWTVLIIQDINWNAKLYMRLFQRNFEWRTFSSSLLSDWTQSKHSSVWRGESRSPLECDSQHRFQMSSSTSLTFGLRRQESDEGWSSATRWGDQQLNEKGIFRKIRRNIPDRCRSNSDFITYLAEIYRDDLDPDIDNMSHLVRQHSPQGSRDR
jgi:hypothetical protein